MPPFPSTSPALDVSLLFGMDGALSLPYGDAKLSIPANGLKFSVLVRNWPFCNVNNTLRVSLQLMLANNASATTQPGEWMFWCVRHRHRAPSCTR